MTIIDIHMTVGQARRLLAPLIPLAGSGRNVARGAILCNIYVRIENDIAIAVATNRMVIGAQRVDVLPNDDIAGLIDVRRAKDFLRGLPKAKRDERQTVNLPLNVNADEIERYPRGLGKVLGGFHVQPVCEIVGNLDVTNVALFAEAVRHNARQGIEVSWFTAVRRTSNMDHQAGSVHLVVGDFVGAIMPYRPKSASVAIPAWAKSLD